MKTIYVRQGPAREDGYVVTKTVNTVDYRINQSISESEAKTLAASKYTKLVVTK